MADRHARLRNACLRALMIRDADIDDEYGLPSGGGGTGAPAPATRGTLWTAGRLVYPGDVIEPRVENGFQYTATQASPAYTGTTEPVWPTVPAATVVDGGVTWTASAKTSIVWTAIPLYKSGASAPTFPTTLGGTVTDNGITWTARTNVITDPLCPHSRIARIKDSKVFSPYRDVLRFCATDDPTDWTTAEDAGFLAIGTQSPEAPDVEALGEYRGRMVVWTATRMMLWTTDPDPAEMSLYDNLPGLGTTYARGVASIGNDLYYTTPQGVRSLSLSAQSNNLGAGDIGSGIDALVTAKLAGPDTPIAHYYPGNGQWWLIFGNEAFVYTRSQLGKVGAWSRYTFPWSITEAFQHDGRLTVRASDHNFYSFEDHVTHDGGVEFEGVVWTPYLDLGNPGVTKAIMGFDVVGYGTFSLRIGYDQSDTTLYTDAVAPLADTLPGGMLPEAVAAPAMAFKLTYAPGQDWQLNALTVYLEDWGVL